jgi:hypothetical protein
MPSLRLVGWQDPTAGLADGSSDVAFVWLPIPLDDVDVLPARPRTAGSRCPRTTRWQAETGSPSPS